MLNISKELIYGLAQEFQTFDNVEGYKAAMDSYLANYLRDIKRPDAWTHDESWARNRAFAEAVRPVNFDRNNINAASEDFPEAMKSVFNYLKTTFPSELKDWALKQENPHDVGLGENRNDPRIKILRGMELQFLRDDSHK